MSNNRVLFAVLPHDNVMHVIEKKYISIWHLGLGTSSNYVVLNTK